MWPFYTKYIFQLAFHQKGICYKCQSTSHPEHFHQAFQKPLFIARPCENDDFFHNLQIFQLVIFTMAKSFQQ